MKTTKLFLMASRLRNPFKLPQTTRLDWLRLCGVLCLLTTAVDACELPAWQARYNITKYGTTVARLNMSLQTNHDTAQYRLHTEAAGLLAAISNEELTEISELKRIENTSWQLEKFSQQRAKDQHRNQQFTLQQTDNGLIARGEAENKTFQLNVPSPAWDRSSAQLALTCDLLAENKPRPFYDYTIIDNGNIVTYHFEYRGGEDIRIADKKFDTHKFERISGDRSTLFWLAPSLHFMPVRMEQYKKGSLHLRMTLDLPAMEKP